VDKELVAARSKLNKENRRTILKIEQYMESRYINEIACEEILSDIVGMALECQQRNESFLEAIGGDLELFCRELVRNSPRQSRMERVLDVLRWFILFALFLLPGLFVIELVFPTLSPADVDLLEYTVPLTFLLKYLILTVVLVYGWFLVRMFTHKPFKYVISTYFAVFMLFFLGTDAVLAFFLSDAVVTIHLIVWIVSFAVAVLLCDLSRRMLAMTIAYRKRKRESKDK